MEEEYALEWSWVANDFGSNVKQMECNRNGTRK